MINLSITIWKYYLFFQQIENIHAIIDDYFSPGVKDWGQRKQSHIITRQVEFL